MSSTREELAFKYLEQLPYPPYPVQEQALFSWFEEEQGVLVCTPPGQASPEKGSNTGSQTPFAPAGSPCRD